MRSEGEFFRFKWRRNEKKKWFFWLTSRYTTYGFKKRYRRGGLASTARPTMAPLPVRCAVVVFRLVLKMPAMARSHPSLLQAFRHFAKTNSLRWFWFRLFIHILVFRLVNQIQTQNILKNKQHLNKKHIKVVYDLSVYALGYEKIENIVIITLFILFHTFHKKNYLYHYFFYRITKISWFYQNYTFSPKVLIFSYFCNSFTSFIVT